MKRRTLINNDKDYSLKFTDDNSIKSLIDLIRSQIKIQIKKPYGLINCELWFFKLNPANYKLKTNHIDVKDFNKSLKSVSYHLIYYKILDSDELGLTNIVSEISNINKTIK